MTNLSAQHYATAIASMQEDARFIVRTVHAFSQLDPDQRSMMSMALLPSFSLITYESRKWLHQHMPTITQQLPDGEVDRVESIRHAAKWLGANKTGVEAGLGTFRSMRALHEARFLGNTHFRWTRPLESDLGLYRHRGVDVLNTHLLGLILGDLPTDELGRLLRTASETMVRQARLLAHGGVPGPSFLDGVGRISHRDVRSAKYYSKAGRADLSIAGYLHVLWCSLGFLRLLKIADADDEGPIFKLQFVGLFHVAQSLKFLEPALVEDVGELANGDIARRLRNDLVHYMPHDKTPLEALDPLIPRHGLVEHAYGRDACDVSQQLMRDIESLHGKLGRTLGLS